MKYLKYFEKDKYDFQIEEEVKSIIDNYDPYVVKYEDHKSDKYFSVLVKDNISKFETWIDLWIEDGEVNSDWNQISYNLNNSKDMIKRGVEKNDYIYDYSYSISLDKLLVDEMIYEENDEYYYYSDYWYVKEGYKDQGISLEKAKEIRNYNL